MKPKLSRYEVNHRLDSGGMAHVWLATARGANGFQKRVALKTILPHLAANPEFMEMFTREARLAALLNHPNCIQIFDFGLENETLYLAMELIEGLSLARIIDHAMQTTMLPPAPALVARVAIDALAALDYVHRLTDETGRPLGLVHRDVSLDNLLVSTEGRTKLADFGIAKASTPELDGNTRHGFLKGKLGYMAPEYVLGRPFDGRADLFAMGVVLWRALTGRPLDASPDSLPGLAPSELNPRVPAALDAVVARALAQDPDERFGTAREMSAALEEAVAAARPDEVADMVRLARDAAAVPASPTRVAELSDPERTRTDRPPSDSSIDATVLRARFTDENSLVPLPPDEPTDTRHRTTQHKIKTVMEPAPAPPPPPESEPRPRRRFDLFRAGVLALAVLTLALCGHLLVSLVRAPPPDQRATPIAAALMAETAATTQAEPQRTRVAAAAPSPAPSVPSTAPSPAPAEPQRAKATERAAGRSTPAPIVTLPRRPRETFKREREPREPAREEPALAPPAPVASASATPKMAKLDVRASPWAEVKIDGRTIGQTPLALQEVTEGPHLVELSNPELGASRKVRVVAAAGEVTTVRERF